MGNLKLSFLLFFFCFLFIFSIFDSSIVFFAVPIALFGKYSILKESLCNFPSKFFVFSIFVFANEENGLGIVEDADLKAAGVKAENIKKAKELMNQVANNYELRLLERKQLELQINKYILDGPEKYLKQIDEMFDKIGAIEAAIMKERLRSQIQMKKYITTEQYMKAKEIAIKRLSK